MKTILVTGGVGYIGSHTLVELYQSGFKCLVVDNLVNSCEEALRRTEKLVGESIPFIKADLLDRGALQQIFADYDIESVIHFAGLKAVGESVAQPLRYYRNNVEGSINLIEAMLEAGVNEIVFSSSATVYGDPATVPIDESFPLSATNPYGQSKLMVEHILRDTCVANPAFKAVLLRYFNPVGAHVSGTIGEHPQGIPNNLMPYIAQVAVGLREKLSVFGSDYDTPDGTGVRDYIHVVDLAKGHVKALQAMQKVAGAKAINLGTGQGYSVLEMVKAFIEQTGQDVPYELVSRRPGDIASCYASTDEAASFLDWRAEKGLNEMMADTWRWQSANPKGYES